MAVVSLMRFTGDPDELAAQIAERVAPVTARLGRNHGQLANVVARTDDGVLVINLWETEEGRQAMSKEPEVQQAVRSFATPPSSFESHEVVSLRVEAEAPVASA